ncbi:MAG: hypothetical protein R3C15_10850 [Thermoleophilia bacterium]
MTRDAETGLLSPLSLFQAATALSRTFGPDGACLVVAVEAPPGGLAQTAAALRASVGAETPVARVADMRLVALIARRGRGDALVAPALPGLRVGSAEWRPGEGTFEAALRAAETAAAS